MRARRSGVVEDQFGPLVGREPAGVADRQRVRIEHAAGGDDARRADLLAGPARSHPLAARSRTGRCASRCAWPRCRRRECRASAPTGGFVDLVEPAGSEVLVQQFEHRARHPGRHVHAVGDAAHRNLVGGHVRPHRPPHRARHLAVQGADAVDVSGRAQCERRHVELRPVPLPLSYSPSARKRGRCSPISPHEPARCFSTRWNGNGIVTGRHRCVRGEHG